MKEAPPPDAKVIAFLEAFCFFEALARTIGRYYRARHGARSSPEAHESLNRDVVGRSFKYFGVSLSEHTLDLLLSSERMKRGSKSARNLRNGVAHNWTKEDRAEICTRYVCLRGALDKGICAIQRTTTHP